MSNLDIRFKAILDASKFKEGAVLTKQETAEVRRALREMEDPAAKTERRLQTLAAALEKSGVPAEEAAQHLEKYRQHLDKTAASVDHANQSLLHAIPGFDKFNSILAGGAAGAGFATVTAGVGVLKSGFSSLGEVVDGTFERMEKIDKLGKSAEAMGVALEDLTRFQFAASDKLGMDEEAATDALKKFALGIAEVAEFGTGKAADALEALGLDAVKLNAMSATDGIKTVADAMEEIEDRETKAALAAKLFGAEASSLAVLLGDGREEFELLSDKAERFHGVLRSIDAKHIADVNDQLADMDKRLEGIKNQLVVGALPGIAVAIETASDAVDRMFESAERVIGKFNHEASLLAIGISQIGGAVADAADVIDVLVKYSTLDFKGAFDAAGEAVVLDKMLQAGKDLAQKEMEWASEGARHAAEVKQERMTTASKAIAAEDLRLQMEVNEKMERARLDVAEKLRKEAESDRQAQMDAHEKMARARLDLADDLRRKAEREQEAEERRIQAEYERERDDFKRSEQRANSADTVRGIDARSDQARTIAFGHARNPPTVPVVDKAEAKQQERHQQSMIVWNKIEQNTAAKPEMID